MKDNTPAALIVFFMAIVMLVVLDDLTRPESEGNSQEFVNTELNELPTSDMATIDPVE